MRIINNFYSVRRWSRDPIFECSNARSHLTTELRRVRDACVELSTTHESMYIIQSTWRHTHSSIQITHALNWHRPYTNSLVLGFTHFSFRCAEVENIARNRRSHCGQTSNNNTHLSFEEHLVSPRIMQTNKQKPKHRAPAICMCECLCVVTYMLGYCFVRAFV